MDNGNVQLLTDDRRQQLQDAALRAVEAGQNCDELIGMILVVDRGSLQMVRKIFPDTDWESRCGTKESGWESVVVDLLPEIGWGFIPSLLLGSIRQLLDSQLFPVVIFGRQGTSVVSVQLPVGPDEQK
ncbi:MAG: hypothetical protein ABIJ46_00320 [bacterium]